MGIAAPGLVNIVKGGDALSHYEPPMDSTDHYRFFILTNLFPKYNFIVDKHIKLCFLLVPVQCTSYHLYNRGRCEPGVWTMNYN